MKGSCRPEDQTLLTVHDVAPPLAREVLDILTDIRERSIPAVNLAVVPLFHGRYDWRDARDFLKAIQTTATDIRTEILLHGYFHLRVGGNAALPWGKRLRSRLQSAAEDEFYGLDPAEAAARLDLGQGVLRTAFGAPAEGFIPPAWGSSRGLDRICLQRGLFYTEDQIFVRDLRTGRRFFSPVVAFATRSAWREGLAGAWSRAFLRLSGGERILRLALHPADYRSAKTRRLAQRTLDRLSRERQWRLYRDVLPEGEDG